MKAWGHAQLKQSHKLLLGLRNIFLFIRHGDLALVLLSAGSDTSVSEDGLRMWPPLQSGCGDTVDRSFERC